MFTILGSRSVHSDLPLITEADEVLHFDEVPILFTGLNRYRNRVVGSSVDEDEESGFARFFHVLVPPEQYSRFIRREITYLNLLLDSGSIFVIDRSFDEEQLRIYLVDVGDIPSDYLPSTESFCPLLGWDIGALGERYQLALNGRWNLQELGELPNLYIQVYAALYALDEERPANHRRVTEAIQSYPWQGGYSSVNLYTVLRNAVPPVDRPVIAAIQYASPGFLELSLVADVAVRIREVVGRFTEKLPIWEGIYQAHYSYMSERGLLRNGASVDLEKLSQEDLAVLKEAGLVMGELFGEAFSRGIVLRAEHPVVGVKILHSIYRRLRQLARFQQKQLISF